MTKDEMTLIKRLCVLNFLELQEIKRKLKITTEEPSDYASSVGDCMTELDEKMRVLVKSHPHLWDA
jgi:hypothetical protein